MIVVRSIRVNILALLLAAGILVPAQGQDSPAPPAAEGASPARTKSISPNKVVPTEQPQQTGQGLGAFGKVLPVGEKNIDVRIPSLKDGIPSSTVRAGSMTRVDDDNMEMEKMDIRLFGDTHDKDVRIQLPTALYHMPSQILSSNSRSRVSRADFDLQGDSMVYDTRTQQGKMVGNVRMVIYDADSFAPDSKSDEDSKKKEKSEPTQPPATNAVPSPTSNEKK